MLVNERETTMFNPCEECIHQSKLWSEEPCCKCGFENGFIYCEDNHGNLLYDIDEHVSLQEVKK